MAEILSATESARRLKLHLGRTLYIGTEIIDLIADAIDRGIFTLDAEGRKVRGADRRKTARTTPDRRK